MVTSKKWYASKIFWASFVTILIGLVPLLLEFFRTVMPTSMTTIAAVLALISGVLTMIWRLFFTDQAIG